MVQTAFIQFRHNRNILSYFRVELDFYLVIWLTATFKIQHTYKNMTFNRNIVCFLGHPKSVIYKLSEEIHLSQLYNAKRLNSRKIITYREDLQVQIVYTLNIVNYVTYVTLWQGTLLSSDWYYHQSHRNCHTKSYRSADWWNKVQLNYMTNEMLPYMKQINNKKKYQSSVSSVKARQLLSFVKSKWSGTYAQLLSE